MKTRRIIAPFGFYGWGNIGDEATLNGFARLLKLTGIPARVSVASRSPAHTARVEPSFRYFSPVGRDVRRYWAKWRASAHAIVGGTPIMDVLGKWPLSELTPLVRAIERWKVPMAFIGVGTESLRLDSSRRIVANEIVPRVRHWSVRSEHDERRLREYGVPPAAITVAADMAWLMERASPDFGRNHLKRCGIDLGRRLIGVNVVNENGTFDKHPEMVDAIASSLDALALRLDAQVIFLANEIREGAGFDKASAAMVLSRMGDPGRGVLIPNDYLSPQQMMSVLSCCRITLSMRYHFCLFSALQGVPFIAVQRSGKVADLCNDMEWHASVVPPAFKADDIISHGVRLHEEWAVMEARLKGSTVRMRQRALRNAAALNVL